MQFCGNTDYIIYAIKIPRATIKKGLVSATSLDQITGCAGISSGRVRYNQLVCDKLDRTPAERNKVPSDVIIIIM